MQHHLLYLLLYLIILFRTHTLLCGLFSLEHCGLHGTPILLLLFSH